MFLRIAEGILPLTNNQASRPYPPLYCAFQSQLYMSKDAILPLNFDTISYQLQTRKKGYTKERKIRPMVLNFIIQTSQT